MNDVRSSGASSSFDAIVIGAGANGLVASAALGRAGMRVLVLERAEAVAGQARLHEFAPGFRAAPLGLDAGWVPPVVQRGLALRGLDRVQPATPFSVALEGGELLCFHQEPPRAADAIRKHSPHDAGRWPAFITQMRALAGFLEQLYQLPPPDVDTVSVREAWPLLGLARRFRALGRQDMTEFLRAMPMPIEQLAEDWFESGPVRAAVAACGVRDIRHGPRAGGTGFLLLHHLVGAAAGSLHGRGAWRARPDEVAVAAEWAARQHGVTIRTDAHVVRILVHDDAAAGVVLQNGEEVRARRVLSTADPARTLLGMVDPVWLDPELLLALRNVRFRGCTAFVLYALDGMPELPGTEDAMAALAGNVSLTTDTELLERAADAVKYGGVAERPHIEFTAPTIHWPELAPAGKHVLVARVQYAPYRLRDGAAWDAARTDALADCVTSAIERAVPGLRARVLHRTALSPRDLEQRYGFTEGAFTHGELGLDQILFMRPVAGLGNYATPISGLYLCGAGSHPGPGVAGGAGWLAAQRALAERGRTNASPRG